MSVVGFPDLGNDSWAGRAPLMPCQEEKNAVGGRCGSIQPQLLQATMRCPKTPSSPALPLEQGISKMLSPW